MNDMLKSLFYFILFPGFLFTSIVGLYLCWLDRKLTARIQSRQGPPWYQCYADIFKLMGKTMILPKESRKAGFLIAPILGLAGITLISTILWGVNIHLSTGFLGDLIVILYLLMLPSLALIIGGSSSKNPFGAIGAGREMKLILAYELPFIIAILTGVIKVKSILLGDFLNYQFLHGVLVRNPSCIIAFMVCLPCIQAKLGYIPFDIPEAETEIIGGTLAEYSGSALALFKLTNAMMVLILPVFLITLFWGGVQLSLQGFLIAIAKYSVIFLLIVIAKTTHPRLRIDQAVRFFWYCLTPIAIAGIVLVLIGV